jgi:hypothetical protein
MLLFVQDAAFDGPSTTEGCSFLTILSAGRGVDVRSSIRRLLHTHYAVPNVNHRLSLHHDIHHTDHLSRPQVLRTWTSSLSAR